MGGVSFFWKNGIPDPCEEAARHGFCDGPLSTLLGPYCSILLPDQADPMIGSLTGGILTETGRGKSIRRRWSGHSNPRGDQEQDRPV